MKKLLMVGAILVLGTVAMGEELGKTTAPVYLQAEIVQENLIVSGIDGRDILLDFGRINKSIDNNRGRGAEAEFKVEYVGSEKNTTGNTLDIVLQNKEVTMKHTTLTEAETMTATLDMSDRLGTTFTGTTDVSATGIEIETITGKGEIYRGKITGILESTEIQNASEGFYEGATQLTVTLNGTKAGA